MMCMMCMMVDPLIIRPYCVSISCGFLYALPAHMLQSFARKSHFLPVWRRLTAMQISTLYGANDRMPPIEHNESIE